MLSINKYFINAIINFFLVAFVLFTIVKIFNRVREGQKSFADELNESKPTKEERKEAAKAQKAKAKEDKKKEKEDKAKAKEEKKSAKTEKKADKETEPETTDE